MAKDHGSSIKNDSKYEGLRKHGMSTARAAAISNSPGASKRGGKNSHKGSSKKSSSSGGSKSSKTSSTKRSSTRSKKAKAGRKGGKASHGKK